MTDRPLVFISAARRDEAWRERLLVHLRVLERQGAIELWFRGRVPDGGARARSSDAAVRDASVAIVLLSQAYLDDKLLGDDELRPLLDRKSKGALSILPALLEPCRFREHPPLVGMRLRPRDLGDRPLSSLPDSEVDQSLAAIVREAHNLRLGPPAAQKPRYSDERSRELGEMLLQARARRRERAQAGDDTSALDEQIKSLHRELRRGGRLTPEDWLGDGRYRLLETLGRGGFATVWKAHDTQRDELVAIKVLHSEHAGDPVRLERFTRGAQRMAELDGDGVVRILEPHGEDDGFHFFVMELIDGPDLRRAVLGEKNAGGALKRCVTQEDIIPIILEVGAALARAHEAGVVHRDIKPANILLDSSNKPYLTDFDLVVERGDSTGGTRTNQALGTVGYASPELLLDAKTAGPPADIYGLAMTAVFGLHGAELSLLVVGRGPRAIIDDLSCSSKLKAVLARAVATKPTDRYESVAAFCDALAVAQSKPKPRRPQIHPPDEPGPIKWGLYGTTGAALLAGAALIYYATHTPSSSGQTPPPPTSTPSSSLVTASAPRQWPRAPPPTAAPTSTPVSEGHTALANVAPMRFVKLPGGQFLMGSPPEEKGHFKDEELHNAQVDPFEMAMYEVTQKQWTTVMKTKPFNCAYGCGENFPAQNVSWADAINFMNTLTDLDNQAHPTNKPLTHCYKRVRGSVEWDWACTGYRLPTEAEWEYAARAGTTTAYSFGDNAADLCLYGNFGDKFARQKYAEWAHLSDDSCDDGFADLATVGKFKPNGWGLFDLHGSVWEWVWDWAGPYSTNPNGYSYGPNTGTLRVLRGGSFKTESVGLRSARRGSVNPTAADAVRGFRCARGPSPSAP